MSLQRFCRSASHLYTLQQRHAIQLFQHARLAKAATTISTYKNFFQQQTRQYNTNLPDIKDGDAILTVLHQVHEDSRSTTYYNHLLKRLASEGRSDQAQKVYDEIFREHHLSANMITYSQLMLAYINDGKYEEAMEIYFQLRDHEDSAQHTDLRLDADTYATMISSLTNSKNMEAHGNRFDVTAVPHYEYSVEDVDTAIFQDIDGTSQPALLTALTLFNDMRHLEIQPTSAMYISMLKACVQQKDGYVLEKLHKLIRMDLYLDPDMYVFHYLMEAYRVVGDGASVLEIWDSQLDPTSISIVFKTCAQYGYKSRAKAIWQDLKSSHVKISVDDFNQYLVSQLKVHQDATEEEKKEEWKELQELVQDGLSSGQANETSVNLLENYNEIK